MRLETESPNDVPQDIADLRTHLMGFDKLHIEDKFFVESAVYLCARRNADLGWLTRFLTDSSASFCAYVFELHLGRKPGEDDIVGLTEKLRDGASRLQILLEMMRLATADDSADTSQLAKSSPFWALLTLLTLDGPDFVKSAYRLALGRDADAGGAAIYKKHLADGTTKIQIAFELLSSHEGRATSAERGRGRIPAISDEEALQPLLAMTPAGNKVDVLGFYDFVLTRRALPIYASPFDKAIRKNTINWLIPDFGIGSGGHLNIFRHIFLLEKRGYKNNICIVGANRHKSARAARELISEHFFQLAADVYFGVDSLPSAYYSFATGWTTAYFLNGFNKTAIKLYFVQDFEPSFYANGSEYDFAEQTYKLGFTAVCAGQWLADLMAKDYKSKAHAIGFSYDRSIYIQTPRREPHIRRVFCYCRPPTVRRGLETALLALNIVGQAMPNVNFIFAGWDMSAYYFPHDTLNAGLLAINELPDLYSQCDVALVLSFTNLSLLPLELMACGCPVVSNRGANTEWMLNDDNSILTGSNPSEIADSIMRVLCDDEFRLSLSKRAMEFAKATSWEHESDSLTAFLEMQSS